MSAKFEEAAKESLKDLDASQQEQIRRGSEQLSAAFVYTDYEFAGKPLEEIRRELGEKITAKELDAYLIIPNNLDAADAKYEFRSRKAGDFGSERNLRDALNEAVRSVRLAGRISAKRS